MPLHAVRTTIPSERMISSPFACQNRKEEKGAPKGRRRVERLLAEDYNISLQVSEAMTERALKVVNLCFACRTMLFMLCMSSYLGPPNWPGGHRGKM